MESGGALVLPEDIASHQSFPWIMLLQPEAAVLAEQNVHLQHQEAGLGVSLLS